MSATTTYDINVRYQLQDKATKGADNIGKALQRTNRHGRGLLSTMKLVAGGAAIGFGFRAGKKWLIDYNSQMDNAKIKMGALVKLSLGGTWAENQKRANTLVKQFTKDAAVGVGTTADYVELAGDITKPLLDAGGSMRNLTELTKAGVTAAKAFGIAGDVAGRDIQSMMLGTVKSVDRLPKLLGVAGEEWNKMVKEEGPAEMLRQLDKVLNSKTMTEAAEAYGASWDGVTSTLEDNLQRTLGKVGLPLMKTLTAEVKAMNEYFDRNPKKVEQFIKKAGKALVEGFGMVKDVVKFLVANSGTLLSIAKAFVAFKLIRGAGGLLAGPFDMLASYSSKMKVAGSATATFADRMTAAGNRIQGVASMLAAAYVSAKLIADYVDRKQEAGLKRIERRPQALMSVATGDTMIKEGAGRDRAIVAHARSAGLIKDGQIDKARFANAVAGKGGRMSDIDMHANMQMAKLAQGPFGNKKLGFSDSLVGGDFDKRAKPTFDRLEKAMERDRVRRAKDNARFLAALGVKIQQQGIMDTYRGVVSGIGGIAGRVGAFIEENNPNADSQKAKPTKRNGDTKVYINTIKVSADDPDRFAVGMVGAFKNANTKPVASRLSSTIGGRPR